MMAIAEIIHKKWVEPILADNYNRGRVEGLADADQEWEVWLTRRDAAIAAGESFGELPPSRRRQAARRNGSQRLAWLPS